MSLDSSDPVLDQAFGPADAPASAVSGDPLDMAFGHERKGAATKSTWAHRFGGLVDTAGNAIINAPGAAINAVNDLGHRLAGDDSAKPIVPTFHTQASQDLAGEVADKIPTSIKALPHRAMNAVEGVTPTGADILRQTGSVAGDVANILPAVGAVKGVTGMVRGVPGTTAERAAIGEAAPASAEDAAKFATETKAAPKADGSDAEARASVLRSVGFDKTRISALNNDGPAGHSEYQTSKDPTTAQGLAAKQVFDHERTTLNDHADSIVKSTGGSEGLDEATREARGNTILRPFEDLNDHFDAQRKAAYAAADEKAGGTGVSLKSFGDELADDSNLTNSDRQGLKSGLSAYLKKKGMLGEDGNMTGNGQQAETVRKYINENWSPANSGFAGKLKSALDDDVTKAAGSDTYKDARATVAQQKNTLENPDGIAKILDSSGPNSINRKVPAEKVADAITSMPNAQLKHIVDTLDNMPPELQPQAAAAKAEIQAHMASRLQEAGTKTADAWNHKEVNKFMDNNSARLETVFGKDSPQLQDMNNLRAAGNILRVDRSYPGAAIQGRIMDKGLAGAATAAGTGLGAAVGGAVGSPEIGSLVGTGVGGYAAKKILNTAGARAMNRRMMDITKKQD